MASTREEALIIVIKRSTFLGLLQRNVLPVDRPTTVVKVPSRSKLAGNGFPLVLCGGHGEHLLLIFLQHELGYAVVCHPEVVGKGPVAVPRRQEAKGNGQLQARIQRATTPET